MNGASDMTNKLNLFSFQFSGCKNHFSSFPFSLLKCAVLVLLISLPAQVFGQVKYTPEHEDVYAAATKGIEFLDANKAKDMGEAILAAIACIEYTKRYENYVPVDHPLVLHGLAKTKEALEKTGEGSLESESSIYRNSLALILLIECGIPRNRNDIDKILARIIERQQTQGAWSYQNHSAIGDISQTQYAALALWVAKAHKLSVEPDVGAKAMQWLCSTISNNNSWFYHNRSGAAFGGDLEHRHSLHCSGLSTVYLMGDYLQITGNKGGGGFKQTMSGLELPLSVSIHIPSKDGAPEIKEGPLAAVSGQLYKKATLGGNTWLARNFNNADGSLKLSSKWHYYYLYALERYAFFREKAEGRVTEIPTWYDQGVEFLFAEQTGSGGWPSDTGNARINTAFAVMFLVRASQVLVLENAKGMAQGGQGFAEDKKLIFENGQVSARDAIKGVQDVMALLEEGIGEEDLDLIMETMGPAISEMAAGATSRNEQMAFMRGLIGDRDPVKRRIAVRLLAAQQVIENAPALLYALGDPDLDTCEEAHNGLRLISRKIDTFQLSPMATRAEFNLLKEQWTDWYLGVDPGATLLD